MSKAFALSQVPDAAGSVNVGYTPSGTGAVITNVGVKFSNDLPSIKDYGAVGNGVANDSTPQTNLHARLQALGGGAGMRGPGSYLLNGLTYYGGLDYIDAAFPTNFNQQSRSGFQALVQGSNTEGATGTSISAINGTLLAGTLSSFRQVLNTDLVGISSWALRGGAGTGFMEGGNFGVWLENANSSGWALEVDVENYSGATGDSGIYGIGIVCGSSSTNNPFCAQWISWTGTATQGWRRGLWINGIAANGVGIYVEAQATTAIVAFQTDVVGDAAARFYMDANGSMNWGSGSGATDTNLFRGGAANLSTNSLLNIGAGKAYYIGGTQVVGAQQTGYGSPTNGGVIANFTGNTATLAQCGQMISQLVIALKTHGLLGA